MRKIAFIIIFILIGAFNKAHAQGACFISNCTKAGITATNGIQLANKSAGAISILQNIDGTAKGLTIAATSGNASFDGTVAATGGLTSTTTINATTTITAGTGITATTGDITATAGNVVISGALNGVRSPVGTVAALGTNQATCAALPSLITNVTAADGTVGVCLPAGAAGSIGKRFVVINSDTSNALKVYSTGSDTITGQAGSTAISVAAKLFLDCVLYSATAWFCSKGVTPY